MIGMCKLLVVIVAKKELALRYNDKSPLENLGFVVGEHWEGTTMGETFASKQFGHSEIHTDHDISSEVYLYCSMIKHDTICIRIILTDGI